MYHRLACLNLLYTVKADLKRTRNSNTDRSRRGRVAGLERLCISSGSALEKANPFVKEGP